LQTIVNSAKTGMFHMPEGMFSVSMLCADLLLILSKMFATVK